MPLYIKHFTSVTELTDMLNAYFAHVGIQETVEPRPSKNPKLDFKKPKKSSKAMASKPVGDKYEPPTITGLALFLGFDSLIAFETYEARGTFKFYLKRARLIVTAAYEKKLHNSNPSGAIFALKGLRWHDKSENNSTTPINATLSVNIHESGPKPAESEKEVSL